VPAAPARTSMTPSASPSSWVFPIMCSIMKAAFAKR
jgi:hypothetical protein